MRILNKILDFNKKVETRKCWECNGTGEIKERYVASGWTDFIFFLASLLSCVFMIGLGSQIFYKFLLSIIGLIALLIFLLGAIYEYKKQVGERV